MKLFSVLIILFMMFEATAGIFTDLDNAIRGKDYLAARIIIKRLAKSELNYSQWKIVRQVLLKNEGVGWNLLTAWDNRFVDKYVKNLAAEDKKITDADRLALSGKFNDAFTLYQDVLRVLNKNEKENHMMIQQVIHRMGRALYGAGRFSDALTVYDWIGNDYLFLRQVLFEKTWAAFRANKIERALGLIASLHSVHFHIAMEPEILLMQLYIYKRLCRDADAAEVLKRAKIHSDALKTQVTWQDWAKSDFETLLLLKVLDKPAVKVGVVSETERQKEHAWIRDYLEKRFNQEKTRILEQGNQVLAYMNLTLEQSPKELLKIEKLPSKEKLLSSGMHFWDSEDAEEWSDEIGKHYFIGESLCGKSQ